MAPKKATKAPAKIKSPSSSTRSSSSGSGSVSGSGSGSGSRKNRTKGSSNGVTKIKIAGPSKVPAKEKAKAPVAGPSKVPRKKIKPVPTPGPAELKIAPQYDNALLPYLALGFSLQETSGGGLLCGANSLAISLKAVRNLNSPYPIDDSDHYTGRQIAALIKDPRYVDHVNRKIDAFGGDAMFTAEFKQNLLNENNFDVQQLQYFLEIINEERGWNYQLGYITEGYHSRYRQPDKEWQQDFMQHTSTSINTSENELQHPIVWIYSNNFENISVAHAETGTSDNYSHWSGLSPQAAEQYNADIVSGWKLNKRIENDVYDGVWRVTKDCHGNTGDELRVYEGAFVRPWTDSHNSPPTGSIYVQTCDGKNRGLVPMEALDKIVMITNGSTRYQNGDYQGLTIKVPQVKQVPRLFHIASFPMCRHIKSTTKMADWDPDNKERKDSDQLQLVRDGAFVLDLPDEVSPSGFCNIMTITGDILIADPRQLQLLQLPPWGISEIPEFEDPDDYYLNKKGPEITAELKNIHNVTNKDMPRKVADKRLLLESLDFSLGKGPDRGVGLPMYSLTCTYAKHPPETLVELLQDETVLVLGDMSKTLAVQIRDYEGNFGTVSTKNLVPLTNANELPWDIRISTKDLQDIRNAGLVDFSQKMRALSKRKTPTT